MEGLGKDPKVSPATTSDEEVEFKYTWWERILDFFYFYDYYIFVIGCSLALIWWAIHS